MSWVKVYGGCSRTIQQYTPRKPPTNSACPSLFKQTLTDLLALTAITKISVDRFFPLIVVNAPMMTTLDAAIDLSPPLFVRYMWILENPKKTFVMNELNINVLKDIYLQYGFDWTTDPVLNPQ